MKSQEIPYKSFNQGVRPNRFSFRKRLALVGGVLSLVASGVVLQNRHAPDTVSAAAVVSDCVVGPEPEIAAVGHAASAYEQADRLSVSVGVVVPDGGTVSAPDLKPLSKTVPITEATRDCLADDTVLINTYPPDGPGYSCTGSAVPDRVTGQIIAFTEAEHCGFLDDQILKDGSTIPMAAIAIYGGQNGNELIDAPVRKILLPTKDANADYAILSLIDDTSRVYAALAAEAAQNIPIGDTLFTSGYQGSPASRQVNAGIYLGTGDFSYTTASGLVEDLDGLRLIAMANNENGQACRPLYSGAKLWIRQTHRDGGRLALESELVPTVNVIPGQDPTTPQEAADNKAYFQRAYRVNLDGVDIICMYSPLPKQSELSIFVPEFPGGIGDPEGPGGIQRLERIERLERTRELIGS